MWPRPRTCSCVWTRPWPRGLQAVAEVEGRPVSEIVREAIRDLVEVRRHDKRFQKQLLDTARQYEALLGQLRDRTR